MSLIKGIYAASMSVLNDNLTLNVPKTIKHAEELIDSGCHGVAMFGSTGHYETKKTGLWLRGLDPLKPTDIKDISGLPKKVVQRLHYLPPSKDRWKIRSTTYKGIALAMSQQWG